MNTKQTILSAIQRLPEDTSFDEAIECMRVLQSIEVGIEQVDRGDVMDHDEFMAELMNEDETEQNDASH